MILGNNYDYPEQDFCLFQHFPHKKLVYPLVDPGLKINCSCTILWLVKYTSLYFPYINSTNEYQSYIGPADDSYDYVYVSLAYCLFMPNIEQMYQKCEFDKLKMKCNKSEFNSNETNIGKKFQFNNDYDLVYLIKFFEYVLLVILNPIFAFLGIITNLMVVYVIYMMKYSKNSLKNNKNRPKESMFDHIMIHSVFNAVYCIIMMLKLVNECLYITPSLFCSSVLIMESSQYFKIIFIEFFGNIIKICCNVSYTAVTLSRLILMHNKRDGCFKYLKKFKIIYYLLILFVVSSVLSIFKLYQYKVDGLGFRLVGNAEFPSEIRNLIYCVELEYRFSECKIFNGIKMFNNVINNILFFLLTIILDIILLNGITDIIRHKMKVLENIKLEEEEKKKKKLSIMVLVNGVIYLISHLPEFLTMSLLIVYNDSLVTFCLNKMRCDKLNEMAQFFNYISILSQFSINKNFNRLFNETYQEILHKIKKKLNCHNQKTF